MENYSEIIEQKSPGEKTAENVRKAIPVLVGWAKRGETKHTYGDLIKKLGHSRYSGIGVVLGVIKDVTDELGSRTGEVIPTLNALVVNKNGLPSNGFFYVHKDYEKMDRRMKEYIVESENKKALNYKNWDWVLASLGLTPDLNSSDIESIRKGTFGYGGEGEDHKRIKEYIAKHPESIGLDANLRADNEFILLSGDRLDVYFPTINLAVEVKPLTSPDSDILRGLFQCVKYKAILDAEAQINGRMQDSRVKFVIEGTLSQSNRNVQETLGIDVIENFNVSGI